MNPSTGEGCFIVYRPEEESPYSHASVKLRGIQTGHDYRVRNIIGGEESTASEEELIGGFDVSLEPGCARVYHFK